MTPAKKNRAQSFREKPEKAEPEVKLVSAKLGRADQEKPVELASADLPRKLRKLRHGHDIQRNQRTLTNYRPLRFLPPIRRQHLSR